MRNSKTIIFSILIQGFTGLSIGFLASLLVYFKQKELFHIGVLLFLVTALYYTSSKLFSKISITHNAKLSSLIFLPVIGILGPQFIYQVRPHTFYISGIIISAVAALCLASQILDDQRSIKHPWKYILFIISFIIGYLIPWTMTQYLVVGILVVITVYVVAKMKPLLRLTVICSLLAVVSVYYLYSKPLVYHNEQVEYEDKVLYTANTQYHELVITQWQKDYWVFIDKLKNISSIDEYLFYEPMAHSIFNIGNDIKDVLIIGGENGCLIREVLKHDNVHKIRVLNYDTLMRNIGKTSPYFTHMNQGSYGHHKVELLHDNLIHYLSNTSRKYHAIFIDLPDPRSIEVNQYYTIEFYSLLKRVLTDDGLMITQAGSPYFASKAYYSIGKTIRKAGFNILPIHNQILTLGEWGWYVSSVKLNGAEMRKRLVDQKVRNIETKWFNTEAAKLISAFGKNYTDTLDPGINTLDNPLVYQYYLKGNWDLN